MQNLSLELISKWGNGTVILSPVNMQEDKIEQFSKNIEHIGGGVMFDPQMFYPKEGHLKLQEYSYWPNGNSTVTNGDESYKIDREILKINNAINSKAIILPGKEMNEYTAENNIQWMKNSANYFKSKTVKPLFGTLCLCSETIRNSDSIELLVDKIKQIPVDGYYIIPRPANDEYIISDQLWMLGFLKLLTCLKLAGKAIIVGYSNHQGLLYSLANVDAIASGTFMNTRSFLPSKFKYPKTDDIKHKSTWYYLPTAFTEYKATTLDVAMQRGYLNNFQPQGTFSNIYSSMLFNGAVPSSTNYSESNSFKHYLFCLNKQCEILTKNSYTETFDSYEFMLNNSENMIKYLKRLGHTGQNRAFEPGLEANRLSMCANDQDYGFRLKLDWNNHLFE